MSAERAVGVLLILIAMAWLFWLGPQVQKAARHWNDHEKHRLPWLPVYDRLGRTGRVLEVMMIVAALFMACVGVYLLFVQPQ